VRAGSVPTSITDLNAGGDLIIGIDGRPVTRYDDMISYLYTNKSPGDSIVLTVLRDGEELEFTVVLGIRP
jgi:S1-C subfamily serine protease